jgi:hypothetical protein
VFVADITHLQELSADVLAKPLHVFAVEPRAAYGFRALGNYHLFGNKYIEVPNEPDALTISYYLRAKGTSEATVAVHDIRGNLVAELKGPAEAGINRVRWNMRAGAAASGGRGESEPPLPPGEFRITVSAAGQEATTVARIRARLHGRS